MMLKKSAYSNNLTLGLGYHFFLIKQSYTALHMQPHILNHTRSKASVNEETQYLNIMFHVKQKRQYQEASLITLAYAKQGKATLRYTFSFSSLFLSSFNTFLLWNGKIKSMVAPEIKLK